MKKYRVPLLIGLASSATLISAVWMNWTQSDRLRSAEIREGEAKRNLELLRADWSMELSDAGSSVHHQMLSIDTPYFDDAAGAVRGSMENVAIAEAAYKEARPEWEQAVRDLALQKDATAKTEGRTTKLAAVSLALVLLALALMLHERRKMAS